MAATLLALTLVLAVPATAPAAHAAPLRAAAAEDTSGDLRQVAVVVVRSPRENGGRPDTLAQIAGRNLGDPDRAAEIFALNRGRTQADGGTLTSSGTLNPGWLLRMPPDAEGPDVRAGVVRDGAGAGQGRDGGAAAGGNGGAAVEEAPKSERSLLRWPIVLAVAGGVALAVLTAVLLLRQRLGSGIGRVRGLVHAYRERVRIRREREEALRLRAELARIWRTDAGSALAARATFGTVEHADGAAGLGPVALELTYDTATVLGMARAELPAPWHRREVPGVWSRPAVGLPLQSHESAARPLRVGGDESMQLFVDLHRCAGALSVAGDPRIGSEFVGALVEQLRATYPDVPVLSLGPSSHLGGATPVSGAAELDRLGLVAPPPRDPIASRPLRAVTPGSALRGVVVVPAGRWETDGAAVVARCSVPGSGWLALCVGDFPEAHWRWTAHDDGSVEIPMLGTTVVAVA